MVLRVCFPGAHREALEPRERERSGPLQLRPLHNLTEVGPTAPPRWLGEMPVKVDMHAPGVATCCSHSCVRITVRGVHSTAFWAIVGMFNTAANDYMLQTGVEQVEASAIAGSLSRHELLYSEGGGGTD